jgi:hypothetical protein
MLTVLRVVNLLIWSALFFYVLRGAISTVTGKDTRRGDPMRLGVAAVCIVIVLGNLRWLVAPDDQTLFIAVYVLTAIVGIYKIILARTYGRGPKL